MEAEEARSLPWLSPPDSVAAAAASQQAARPLLAACTDERTASELRVNGFRTIPEPVMVQIRPENVVPFSMPPEMQAYEPAPESIKRRYSNGKSERYIHEWLTLEAEERQALEDLRSKALRLGHAFYPKLARHANRFLCEYQGDVDKALELMLIVQEHRRIYYADGPIVDESVQSDLNFGIITVCGRDAALRPIIVVRPARAPMELCNEAGADRLVRCVNFVLEYCRDHMWVTGKVESCVLIFDVGGLQLRQVPFACFKKVIDALNMQPPSVLARIFVCRMSFMLRQFAKLANTALSELQKNKMSFVTRLEDLLEYMSPDQLEQDFGGNRENITSFFPFELRPGSFSPNPVAAGASFLPKSAPGPSSGAGDEAELWHDPLEEDAMPSSAGEFAQRREPAAQPEERLGCCRRRCRRCWRTCGSPLQRQAAADVAAIELTEARELAASFARCEAGLQQPRQAELTAGRRRMDVALPLGQAPAPAGGASSLIDVRVDPVDSESGSFHSALG